ncbi:MAG: GTPase ObgE [Candidatus Omnitrophica bacterium]|nr:GTPase ObgE [Candidatus Omnitrophota bacterium]
MLIDTARIYIKAGDGGDGCNSFEKDRAGRKVRHSGGPGGKGGDIIFEVDENVRTLLDFQYRQHFGAARGGHGSSNNKKGFSGEDRVIKVPPGTLVKDIETGSVLADLIKIGGTFLAARGGLGGAGNSRHRPAEEGGRGEEKTVILELKLIADVGIVGFPNAGKSTLISRISRARPKIADYPFTTKEPILGVVRHKDREFVVADIPGLIEGAHAGRGLGDRFLKHIERTGVLIHLVDTSGLNGRDPERDYRQLNKELGLYSETLAKKPQVVAANKIDVGKTAQEALRKFRAASRRKKILPISAKNGQGLDALLSEVVKILGC